MKILIFFCIAIALGCKNNTNTKEGAISEKKDSCSMFIEKENSILGFLIRHRKEQVELNCEKIIYALYYNTYFIDKKLDTVYLAYLNVKPYFLNFPMRSQRGIDSSEISLGYYLLDDKCRVLDTAFYNYDDLILDFEIDRNNKIKYLINGKRQKFSGTDFIKFQGPFSEDLINFIKKNNKKVSHSLKNILQNL